MSSLFSSNQMSSTSSKSSLKPTSSKSSLKPKSSKSSLKPKSSKSVAIIPDQNFIFNWNNPKLFGKKSFNLIDFELSEMELFGSIDFVSTDTVLSDIYPFDFIDKNQIKPKRSPKRKNMFALSCPTDTELMQDWKHNKNDDTIYFSCPTTTELMQDCKHLDTIVLSCPAAAENCLVNLDLEQQNNELADASSLLIGKRYCEIASGSIGSKCPERFCECKFLIYEKWFEYQTDNKLWPQWVAIPDITPKEYQEYLENMEFLRMFS